MLRSVAGKVMWLGRATSALVGLAVLLAACGSPGTPATTVTASPAWA